MVDEMKKNECVKWVNTNSGVGLVMFIVLVMTLTIGNVGAVEPPKSVVSQIRFRYYFLEN